MTNRPTERIPTEDGTELRAREGASISLDPGRDGTSCALRLEKLSSRIPHARRYELKGEIARGGMGAILKIWDEDIRRHLAMKVMLSSGSGAESSEEISGDLLRRFLDEAQIAGQLDHPGVVPVYELGVDANGRAYFTMPVVEGRDLGLIIDLARRGEDGWSRTRALEIFVKVCDTLAYAHAKNVIHRDIKPANVMIGRYGEVYVMDWGLAKVLGCTELPDGRTREQAALPPVQTDRSETSSRGDFGQLTIDGTIMGTPAYMPPEQAHGRIEDLGPRSDVYSVGAMLYHLLAGHPPFLAPGAKKDLHALLARVRDGVPMALSSIDRSIPAELVAICEKAMARDPAKRYAGSGEMSEDLRAFLESRVVKAHRSGAVAELRKWVQRNRGMAVASALALLAFLGGAIASLAFGSTAIRQRNRAATATKAADQRRSQAEDLIGFMLGDLREKLEPQEQLEILDDVGERALAYFETVAEAELSESELASHALALKQIGEVRLKQWRFADALKAFEAAFRRSRELAARAPQDGDLLYDRGQAEFWIGYVHWQRLELERAIEWMTIYLATSEALRVLDPARTDWIREVAYGHHNLSVIALDFGDLHLAAEGFRSEVELIEDLLGRSPSTELQEDLADAYSYRGTTARRLGALQEAADCLAASTGLRATLHEAQPEDRRKEYWWALASLLQGEVLVAQGALEDAFRVIEAAERTLDRLVLLDPSNAEWSLQRSVARMEVARVGRHRSEPVDAAERARLSEHEFEALVAAEPKSRNGRRGLARARGLVARLAADDGALERARQANASALAMSRVLVAENPRDLVSVADLAEALLMEAELSSRAMDLDTAASRLREAVALLEPATETSGFDRLLDPLARALHGLGRREESAALVARLGSQGYRPLQAWPRGD
jgi:serine/threonine-protein kinase